MNILIIGSGAREHAIARALMRSPQHAKLFCFGSSANPGIKELSVDYTIGNLTDGKNTAAHGKKWGIDFAVIGPEAPLGAGVVDALARFGIPSVGPTKQLAQIETSKSFARDLLTTYGRDACPRYKAFATMDGVKNFLEELTPHFVVKADGLMGGKGVKVAGDHLHSTDEALAYCEELIKKRAERKGRVTAFVIEEKIIGQEFSLMSFSDGIHIAHMPPVQDYKRAFVGHKGPNTGGMGSYSDANHLLPFLQKADVQEAQKINEKTIAALRGEGKTGYKGILYGGFMLTAQGVKLIEYNARFGDPEAMNVLGILETDFVKICQEIIDGRLNKKSVQFARKATVCKYAVPEGYPDSPAKGARFDISNIQNKEQLYFGTVKVRNDGLYTTDSRTVAILGIGNTLAEAEHIAEEEINRIKGPLYHREDIGKSFLEYN